MKYYSIIRPIMPGSFPEKSKVVEIVNFDGKKYCEDIGRSAWGYIEYSEELDENVAYSYDLVRGEKKLYYKVVAVYNYDTYEVTVEVQKEMAAAKPAEEMRDTDTESIMIQWYNTLEEAEEAAEDIKNAA